VVIKTDKAPDRGRVRVTQAIKAGGFVFVSGMLGMNPKTGKLGKDIHEQATLIMENMKNILEAAGSSLDKAVKVTIFMSHLNEDFDTFNKVFYQYFPLEISPTRSTVEVKSLVFPEARVEMDLIATT
jgi:2-iminobutanoate/2-iminopropanoate deaminase